MRKTLLTGLVVGLLTIVMAVPALASNGKSADSNGRASDSTLTVIVTGPELDPAHGLAYDSFVTTELPAKGPFQKLMVVDGHLVTAYGPGDTGYVGGRWWLDANNNGEMDSGETFLCPLLGPGQPVG